MDDGDEPKIGSDETVPCKMVLMVLRVKNIVCYLAFLAASMLALDAPADIYSYTDKNGTVHFTNSRPKGKNSKKFKVG